jgi:hypothetical protein
VNTTVAARSARREDLAALVSRLPAVAPGLPLYLVGDTSQLWEGWLERVPAIHLAAGLSPAPATLSPRLRQLEPEIATLLESPADVVPVPRGAGDRHRPLSGLAAFPAGVAVRHYDPYSVAFRCLARGDDPDYRTILRYLQRGWMVLEEMDALLEEALPRFTRETIAQDPAEFRRKYRGLCQMWRAEQRRESGRAG